MAAISRLKGIEGSMKTERLLTLFLCCTTLVGWAPKAGRWDFEQRVVPGNGAALLVKLSFPGSARYLLSARNESRADTIIRSGVATQDETASRPGGLPAAFREFSRLPEGDLSVSADLVQLAGFKGGNSIVVIEIVMPLGKKILLRSNEETVLNLIPAEGVFVDGGKIQQTRNLGIHSLLAYLQLGTPSQVGKPQSPQNRPGPHAAAVDELAGMLIHYEDLGNSTATANQQPDYLCTLALTIGTNGAIQDASGIPSGHTHIKEKVLRWKFRPSATSLTARVPVFITPDGKLISALDPRSKQ